MAEGEDGMVGDRIEVVHVGSASRDLAPDDPRGWRLGGGATYAALTTARLGLRTAALIGVDEAAASAEELDLLRDAGVELRLALLDEGPVFDNQETSDGRVQISHAAGRPMTVPAIPDRWIEAGAWSLVPVAGELGDDWAPRIPAGAYVALGWQGLLRDLVAGERVTRRAPITSALLRRADLASVSRHDLDAGTNVAALARLLHPGADLVVTEGHAGGQLIRVGEDGTVEMDRYPPVAGGGEVDATGAGDTFLAALLATIVRPDVAGGGSRHSPDLGFAAAAGSLAIEGFGLAGVPDLNAVLARVNQEATPGDPLRRSRPVLDLRRTP
jgi:sugar/nucleoside kinase (ribokinase family)